MNTSSRADLKSIVTGLKKSALFSGLGDRQLKRLAHYAMVQQLAAGAVVVKRGDTGAGFYVVLDGQLAVRRGTRTVARLGPGDFFGELALFDKRARSADVVTLEPTNLVALTRWEFWGFAGNHPDILRTILAEMARRLAENARAPVP
jgi:CRP-like cAMP-binding protein